jgi:hypothetical protein
MLKEPTPLLEQYPDAAINPSLEGVKMYSNRCLQILRYSTLRSVTFYQKN